jgi:hypothetical protein
MGGGAESSRNDFLLKIEMPEPTAEGGQQQIGSSAPARTTRNFRTHREDRGGRKAGAAAAGN